MDEDAGARTYVRTPAGRRRHAALLAHRTPATTTPPSAGSFTWVRVGQGLAGANYGPVFTPRRGQEVPVAFCGGEIDWPIVVGAVYNGQGTADAQDNDVAGGERQRAGAVFEPAAGGRLRGPPSQRFYLSAMSNRTRWLQKNLSPSARR